MNNNRILSLIYIKIKIFQGIYSLIIVITNYYKK